MHIAVSVRRTPVVPGYVFWKFYVHLFQDVSLRDHHATCILGSESVASRLETCLRDLFFLSLSQEEHFGEELSQLWDIEIVFFRRIIKSRDPGQDCGAPSFQIHSIYMGRYFTYYA